MSFKTTITNEFAAGALTLMVSIAGIAPVSAQTPDGQTPAEETVCDPLKEDGVAKGLYGLCVAYCEAHDAEIISPTGDPTELDTPNRKILENYRKKMKAGDPDMPCVQDLCPCWSAQELASIDGILRTNVPLVSHRCRNIPGEWLIQEFGRFDSGPAFESHLARTRITTVFHCTYFDQAVDASGAPVPPNVVRNQFITEEEHSACQSQIIDRCEELGL